MAAPRHPSPSRSRAPAPRKLTTSAADSGRALADFLADRLALDRTEAAALVTDGAVYLDRRRVEDPAHPLGAAHRLTVHLPPAPGTTAASGPPPPPAAPASGPPPPPAAPSSGSPPPPAAPASRAPWRLADWIVHQDREVIVVDKPPGVPSQATRAAATGALDRMVLDQIDREARLLHRLDRDASGLVLFTRTPAARRRFAALLAAYQLERIYCAAVWGHWASAEGALSGPIGRDPHDHRRMVVGPGRPALTRFRLVRRGSTPGGEPVSLLQLELVTGRTHQIRVHLADAGHPICGDALYGPGRPALERLFLHAHRLAWPGGAPVLAPVPIALADLVG